MLVTSRNQLAGLAAADRARLLTWTCSCCCRFPIPIPNAGGLDDAVDPVTNTVYVTVLGGEGPGSVAAINGRTRSVAASVPVGRFPRRIAVNPLTSTVYVTNTGSRSVSVIAG